MKKRLTIIIAEADSSCIGRYYAAKETDELSKIYEDFFNIMLELLEYGEEKHKENSFQQIVLKPDFKRTQRLSKDEIAYHLVTHYREYAQGKPHDKFNDLEHQLAAVAINAMMEYVISKKERENEGKI